MEHHLPPKSLLIMGSWRHFNQRCNILIYSACYCEDTPQVQAISPYSFPLVTESRSFRPPLIFHFLLSASIPPDTVKPQCIKTAAFMTNYSPKSENNKCCPSFQADCDGLDLFLFTDHCWIIQEAAVVTEDDFSRSVGSNKFTITRSLP